MKPSKMKIYICTHINTITEAQNLPQTQKIINAELYKREKNKNSKRQQYQNFKLTTK